MERIVAGETTRLEELSEGARQVVCVLDGLAVDATSALFEAYGIEVGEDRPGGLHRFSSAPLVSVIGFSSEHLSGSLVLALPRSVVERTLPVPNGSVADWSCELANQLLGRFKNQLLKRGVALNMTLPVVVSGELTLVTSARPVTRHYTFSSPAGQVFVRLDMTVSAGLELIADDGADAPGSMEEGEQLFF